MHVSDKISYHLSDAFFKNLLAADIVSNESDPETWDDILGMMNPNELYAPYNFYSAFYLKPVQKKEIKTVFTNNNYFTSMLSGVEGAQSDFQENTVLDMFIYQTGRKYKKRIVGLESAKGSMLSIMKMKPEDSRPDDKNREVLMKLMKSGNFNETLKDYYREKDIIMLDSIYKLMLSKNGHDILITNRNMVMAKSIDSLAQTGSLFSAVGAAHLAGKTGIIQLLRDKGYTVNPIIDKISDDGKNQKKTIEDYFPNPGFVNSGSNDEMIKLPLNKKIIHTDENIGSPDFTNGGAINVKRISLNYFLDKKNEAFNPKALDSLFFENIAGDILDKKQLQEENFLGYDIKNATKNGNNQHWRFYITPLELIAVSMTGSGNYTKQFENEVFDKIKIKPFKKSWEKIIPKKGGFSVEVPAFNYVHGNSDEKLSNIEIQAFDNEEKAYYFVTERTLNSTYFLENSEFEQKQIHYEFYLQQDIDSTNTNFDQVKKSFTSESKIGERKIKLKSMIDGNKYYLLGTVNSSEANTSRFFNSFSKEKLNYTSKTRTFTDTIAKFKIDIPEKQNENLFLDIAKEKFVNKNKFTSKTINYSFNSESGQTVNLEYFKFHKYQNIKNLDSVKVQINKVLLKEEYLNTQYEDDAYENEYDYNTNSTSLLEDNFSSKKGFSKSLWNKIMYEKTDGYEIISRSELFDKEQNVHIYNALVSMPNATQAIKYKIYFKEDATIELSALVDKDYKNDDSFIEKTFNSLVLTAKNKTSVFDDKFNVFLQDAMSEKDTIRYSAMKSIYELNVDKNDFEKATKFIDTFKFKDNETNAVETLLEKIGAIDDSRVIPYLEKIYKKDGAKTAIQISTLKALANQKSKNGYKKIIELLEYDLPISDNEYDISGMFKNFEKDLENSKELFPKIFQFYSIKEYNVPIIDFCNKLFDNNLVTSKKLKSYKKIIATNAKLEYKRMASWKEKNPIEDDENVEEILSNTIKNGVEETSKAVEESNEELSEEEAVNEIATKIKDYSDEVETTEAPTENLINYMNLISNFEQDVATNTLFNKIKTLNIPQLNMELIRLGILNNKLSSTETEEYLNNPKTRYAVIQLLINKGKNSFYNKLSDDEIAASAVINFQSLKEKDAIKLLDKKIISNNGKEVSYYFFEITRKVKEPETAKKEFYTVAFVNENGRINPLAYKVLEGGEISEDEAISKKTQSIITKSLNEKHSRASFEKEKEVENNFLYDQY